MSDQRTRDVVVLKSRRCGLTTEAANYHALCMKRVAETPPPAGQKFAPGTRVWIADDLGRHMSHFPSGVTGTVHHTYAHAYGGSNVRSYCVDVDGRGRTAWYEEWQLTEIAEEPQG